MKLLDQPNDIDKVGKDHNIWLQIRISYQKKNQDIKSKHTKAELIEMKICTRFPTTMLMKYCLRKKPDISHISHITQPIFKVVKIFKIWKFSQDQRTDWPMDKATNWWFPSGSQKINSAHNTDIFKLRQGGSMNRFVNRWVGLPVSWSVHEENLK